MKKISDFTKVILCEDPEAPRVFPGQTGSPAIGGMLHLELTIEQCKYELKKAVTTLKDLAMKATFMERRQQRQRLSLAEMGREWIAEIENGWKALAFFMMEILHSFFLSNSIAGCLCLPLHLLMCCGTFCCSFCKHRQNQGHNLEGSDSEEDDEEEAYPY